MDWMLDLAVDGGVVSCGFGGCMVNIFGKSVSKTQFKNPVQNGGMT